MSGSEIAAIGSKSNGEDNGKHTDYTIILSDLHDLSFSILGLSNNNINLNKSLDSKAGAVDGIAVADAYSNICFFDGHEVVSSISNHAYFHFAGTKYLLPYSSFLKLGCDLLFMLSNNQCFIIGWYPCKNYNPVFWDYIKILLYESIINCKNLLFWIPFFKSRKINKLLSNFPLVFNKYYSLHWFLSSFFMLSL